MPPSILDLAQDSLTTADAESQAGQGRRSVPRIAAPSQVPALQAPLYTPDRAPQLEAPSNISRLVGPASETQLPARQAPWYSPESPARLPAPQSIADVAADAGRAAPPAGPIERAAGAGSRLAPMAGAAGLLAGGAAATGAAAGTVASNPEYFRSSIGDDGLAANILTAGQAPQTIADVARNQPTTARTQNGPLSVPVIAQMASGDSTAGAGRGSVNPPNAQPSPIAALATMPKYDDTYRAGNLRNMQNEAYREGDPIGQIISQRLGQPASAADTAPRYLAAQAGGIIGGGDTVYSPGQPARTSPYQTADGRKIDPNDANLSAADSALIGQYKAQNAQALADIERQQRTNPLAGAVQIIRPGSQVSYAVQGRDRMIEMEPAAYDAYQSAIARNPQLGSRMQMTEGGMRVDGMLAPPTLVDAGEGALKKFAQGMQQSALNAANPLAADTAAKIEVERAKGQNALAVAQAQNQAGKVPQGYRWAADGQSMEKIPGGPADLGKALPGPAVKELSAAGASVEDNKRLANTFKPEYGGHYILGDMSNKLGRLTGDNTQQAQWWQDMDLQQNQARHALFGSALTKGELDAWDKTSINPRMDSGEIVKNLTRRAEIESRAASKLARSYEAAGYNKEQIKELLGTAAEYLDKPAPAVQGQTGATSSGQQTAASQGTSGQKAPLAPPQAAIDYLHANPKTKAEFDARFGQGAADSILSARKFANGGLIGEGFDSRKVNGFLGDSNPLHDQINTVMSFDAMPDRIAAAKSFGMGVIGVDGGDNQPKPTMPGLSPSQKGGAMIDAFRAAPSGTDPAMLNALRDRASEVANPGYSANPAPVSMGNTVDDFTGGGGILSRFANGGLIKGPGTGTSDSIPAVVDGHTPIRVSDGEYIIPASIVKKFGKKFFDMLVRKDKE